MKKARRRYVPEELLFDKRLLTHNLSNGIITPDELKKYVDSLPDLSDRVAHFEPPEEEGHKGGE